MRVFLIGLALASGGCGGSGAPDGRASYDLCCRPAPDLATPTGDDAAAPDLATDDLGADDLAAPADSAIGRDFSSPEDAGPFGAQPCVKDADCRLYSSYCMDLPCQCIALSQRLDPQCVGPKVSCLLDPCRNKSAVCGPDRRCAIL